MITSVQPIHQSATRNGDNVEKELLSQIRAGHYIIDYKIPKIISPLSAIPKSDGVHIIHIHDGSRPIGDSMNDYASLHLVTYQSLDDAVALTIKNYWVAKADLKNAYRSVPHLSNRLCRYWHLVVVLR